jgi:EcsC protein family
VRAPEYVALAAAERHGPAAAAWVINEGRRNPRRLARRAKRAHARLARFGGAATGVGGWMTIAPDLAALGWIQSRMVFFIAAAFGFDPLDRMRPAELLVLWELFDEPVAAREALDGAGRTVAEAAARRAVVGSDEAVLARLARAAAARGGRHLAGRMIPGAAVVFNAVGNERATRDLANRAIAFYGG